MTKLDINTPLTHAIGLDVNGNEVVVKLITPLYAHPTQKPLSDEEIFELCPFDDEISEESFYQGARAIEAKLKEKNI